jgi:Ca2+/Na+ antiporter
MTKKGFGEMAITGSIASAIFCILVGLGLSTFIPLFKNFLNNKPSQIAWTAFNTDGSFEKSSIVPLTLIISLFLMLILLFLNACRNSYHLVYKFQLIPSFVYIVVISALVYYVLYSQNIS